MSKLLFPRQTAHYLVTQALDCTPGWLNDGEYALCFNMARQIALFTAKKIREELNSYDLIRSVDYWDDVIKIIPTITA